MTTVEVSKRKIGNLAVTILDDLINTTDAQPPVKILVGANLVARSSVAERAVKTHTSKIDTFIA